MIFLHLQEEDAMLQKDVGQEFSEADENNFTSLQPMVCMLFVLYMVYISGACTHLHMSLGITFCKHEQASPMFSFFLMSKAVYLSKFEAP